MKNKELLHQALKLNDNKGVEQLIKRFLLSNELSNNKFNIYNYVAGKKSPYHALKGVLHEGKYKIATDAHILIVLEEEYPEEIEGKIIDKEGKEIDEQFPNWKSVIPKDNNKQIDIPFAEIKTAYKQYKIDKRIKDDIIGLWKLGEGYFQIGLLHKLIIFAEYIGATQFKLGQSGKAGIVEANNSIGLIMPITFKEQIEEHRFYN